MRRQHITVGEGRVCNVTKEFVVKEYLFLNKFGSRGSGDGQLNQPWDIAVNHPSTANVYVADTANNRIEVFFLDPVTRLPREF